MLKLTAMKLFKASGETGLDGSVFPINSLWTIDQILDNGFYPN